MATSSESSEIRPAILYGDYATPCRPEIDCKMNDLEWLFDVKIRFRPALCCRIDASFGANSTNLNEDDPYYQRQKYRPMTLVGFMQIFAGVTLGGDIKRHWRLSRTAILAI